MLLKWFHLDVTLLLEDMSKSLKQSIILWQVSNNSKLYAYLIVYNVEPYIR